MRDPGVEVRPLHQITDESDFNEVFFSDVFVPDDRIIGPENEGWQVANATLTHERGVNPRQLVVHTQLVDELLRLATENGTFDDHRNAQRLAEAFVEVQIFRLHNWRSISRTAKGEVTGAGRQHQQDLVERDEQTPPRHRDVRGRTRRTAVAGAQDQNPGGGAWQRSWLYYQASSIWAGTNEIQRNLIGERTLGLPREPRTRRSRSEIIRTIRFVPEEATMTIEAKETVEGLAPIPGSAISTLATGLEDRVPLRPDRPGRGRFGRRPATSSARPPRR